MGGELKELIKLRMLIVVELTGVLVLVVLVLLVQTVLSVVRVFGGA